MNIEKVKAVNMGNYGMNCSEFFDLLREADKGVPDAILLAFKFGFIRGQRAEKAHTKKKTVKA